MIVQSCFSSTFQSDTTGSTSGDTVAHLPPLDWQHVPVYAAMSIVTAALLALSRWHELREYRRKVALVRPKLASQRCQRCGVTLSDWDGRFLPGDVHFYKGGYLPRVRVHCAGCRAEQVFYVSWECRPVARWFDDDHECRLINRDALFGGILPKGRGA
jgi:hypothetical protein